MHTVILICTVHEENGHCNSTELYSIIKRVNPDLLFEELSLSAYNECYGPRNRITLETSAIKMYLLDHEIIHIPVVNAELTDDVTEKFELLTEHNNYRGLIDTLISLERKYGFHFLNSDQCDEWFRRMKQYEEVIVESIPDDVSFRLKQSGDQSIDDYEHDIIKNIYRYSEAHHYSKAILFIGAAHRNSIMNKIRQYEVNQKLRLNWIFWQCQIPFSLTNLLDNGSLGR